MLMALFAPLAMNGQSAMTMTVYENETATNSYIPLYGYDGDYYQKTEFVIPASELTALNGKAITQMAFYISGSNPTKVWGPFQVFLKEVNFTTISAWQGDSGATTVYTGTFDGTSGTVTVAFNGNTPTYTYNGGNLLVGVYLTTTDGQWNSASFYGKNVQGASGNGYDNSSLAGCSFSQKNFVPRTTFTYLTSDPSIVLNPTSATVMTGFSQTLTASTFNVTGTPTITYTSSNTSVATVSGSGTTATVTGVAPGTATITASMTVNGTPYTATCAITVEAPHYCTPNPSSVDGVGITAVNFGTGDVVSNSNSNGLPSSSPFYGDYTSMVGSFDPGATATVSITYTTGSSTYYNYGTLIWVDWNKDYTFDDSEIVFEGQSSQSSNPSGPHTLDATFTVPANQAADDYRMRIAGADSYFDRYLSGYSDGNHDACFSSSYAVCHDYTLRVNSASNCPAPTNLTATNLMPTSATLNWEGEAESYNVRYRATSSGFSYNFETATPWAVDNFSPCTTYDGDGSATGSIQDVTFTNQGYTGSFIAFQNGVTTNAASHSGNAFGACFFATTPANNDYFILPAITIENGYVFKFWAKSFSSSYRESFRAGVYNGNGNLSAVLGSNASVPNTWTEYSYNLSSYVGQTIQLAIHCNSNDCFAFFIDDIFVGDPNFTPTWSEPITGVTSPYILTGLNSETDYEFQVQADCGTEGESNWSASATFTTPDACAVPTGLTAEVTGNTAELSWTGAQENYNVQYREFDPTVPATIILNVPNDIWNDGSGYQMLLDADATAYEGNSISDYSIFEYLIPTNATYDPNTTGFVINTSVTIQIPAGTYDWFITNPSPDYNNVYVAASNGNVGGSQNNYVFEAGMTYEFTPSLYGNNDGIDVTITDNGNAWTLIEGVTNPYTLTNLSSQTSYQYQVQGVDCDGNGDNTDWSASASFTTGEFYTLPIVGYESTTNSNGTINRGGYYLIASPIGDVKPTAVTNMIPANPQVQGYDLYSFDHTQDNEWVNYRPGTGSPNPDYKLERGKGYLYANQETVTLVFSGSGITSGTQEVPLKPYSTTSAQGNHVDFPGWNLVGNPFAVTAWLEGNRGFYTMDANCIFFASVESQHIEAMQGIFVVAGEDEEEPTVTFTTDDPESKSSMFALNLSHGRNLIDRAIVRLDGGRQLPKLQFIQGSTKVYIPVDGQDYAIVSCEEMGAMPVSFKAEENGSYTLSLNSENVSFAYLHLIDNLTGKDVDLLETPSYSFEAKTTDYANRFKLVFATGDNSNDDNFAFFSNGSFVINNDGAATLQVIDVTGRILSSESINGCTNVNVNAAPGVYMLRLINGNNVKVQKVVVK